MLLLWFCLFGENINPFSCQYSHHPKKILFSFLGSLLLLDDRYYLMFLYFLFQFTYFNILIIHQYSVWNFYSSGQCSLRAGHIWAILNRIIFYYKISCPSYPLIKFQKFYRFKTFVIYGKFVLSMVFDLKNKPFISPSHCWLDIVLMYII